MARKLSTPDATKDFVRGTVVLTNGSARDAEMSRSGRVQYLTAGKSPRWQSATAYVAVTFKLDPRQAEWLAEAAASEMPTGQDARCGDVTKPTEAPAVKPEVQAAIDATTDETPYDAPAADEHIPAAKRGTVVKSDPSDAQSAATATCRGCGGQITRRPGRATTWRHRETAAGASTKISARKADVRQLERVTQGSAETPGHTETVALNTYRNADAAGNALANFQAMAEAAPLGSPARKFWGRRAADVYAQNFVKATA